MYRKGVAITIIFLFVGISILPTTESILLEKPTVSTLDGNTLYVGGSGPGNYTTIQDAIDNASDGDTVFVYDDSSPYYENVVVDKSINLIGEDRNSTIIDGDALGDVVYVSADFVHITGFNIQNSGYDWQDTGIDVRSEYNIINGNTIRSNNGHGVKLDNSFNNIISDNIISSNNEYGIKLDYSSNNIISKNNISNNRKDGTRLIQSSNNTISENIITSNNNDGIWLGNSNSNTITDNNISNNEDDGIHLGFSSDNTISENIISSNNLDGIVLFDTSDNTISENIISNNPYGIAIIVHSSNNAILENTVSNAWHGIFIDSSSNNTISGNTITNNLYYGMFLDFHCDNNNITGNTISSNNYGGICIRKSSDNIISGNTISSNFEDGVYIHQSINNIFYHNNFINNTNQAYIDDGNNTWDNGYPSCGNYWSDYAGVDNYSGSNQDILGSDGVGDTPYDISGDSNQDRYPLMEPYGMTELTINIGTGLFKFLIYIKNVGNTTAFNVQWMITIKGGLVFLGRESSGGVPKPLLPDEETVTLGLVLFGFGRIEITVAAWADNAPLVSKTHPGFLLLFFVFLK